MNKISGRCEEGQTAKRPLKDRSSSHAAQGPPSIVAVDFQAWTRYRIGN
jgi:hypothetical protein